MAPVDLSKSERIVHDGIFRFGCVGALVGLFLEDFVDGGLSGSFSDLVLLCEPFEASYIELLLGVLVLFLDDLENVHDFGSHSLLLNRKIPAVDDFLVSEFGERDDWSNHDNFIERDALSQSSLTSLASLTFYEEIDLFCFVRIDHHRRRFFDILGWSWRPT